MALLLLFPIFSIILNNSNGYDFHCPNGAQILALGINVTQRDVIVNTHNELRAMIARGQVLNQPKGVNLLRMEYDNPLEMKSRLVSMQCSMNHINIKDSRFEVGQNLYLEVDYRFDYRLSQNWENVINTWFNETEQYTFGRTVSMNTGHYTQVVWAETYLIGCDFIMYKDYSDRMAQYHKLYTCNYGPSGNWEGQTPYKIDGIPCNTNDDLCEPSDVYKLY